MEIILSALSRSFEIAGYPLIELNGKEGGSVFVLPYGGRVLGIFTASSNRNFFWVNPQLTEVGKAEKFFKSSGWKNSGGDRTWVSPEIDLFVKNADDAKNTYEVPHSIDPGNYSVSCNGKEVRMRNQAEVIVHRLKKKCKIELSKTIRTIQNPLRHETGFNSVFGKVEFIGYEQETSLEIVGYFNKNIRLGIWNLIQVPAGGEIIIPTLFKSPPRDYFEKTGPHRLKVEPNLIRFVIDAKSCHKIGVKVTALTGRMGYLFSLDRDETALIIRNFSVNPSGDYIDVPWDETDDFGYAAQCYNDNGELGSFGELEYHSPAIGGSNGKNKCMDKSQVWAFRGDKEKIKRILKILVDFRK